MPVYLPWLSAAEKPAKPVLAPQINSPRFLTAQIFAGVGRYGQQGGGGAQAKGGPFQ